MDRRFKRAIVLGVPTIVAAALMVAWVGSPPSHSQAGFGTWYIKSLPGDVKMEGSVTVAKPLRDASGREVCLVSASFIYTRGNERLFSTTGIRALDAGTAKAYPIDIRVGTTKLEIEIKPKGQLVWRQVTSPHDLELTTGD